MLPSRVWVDCPRASNGLLPPRSYLVGYMRWYARSDSSFVLRFLLQTIIPTAFSSQVGNPSLNRQRNSCLSFDRTCGGNSSEATYGYSLGRAQSRVVFGAGQPKLDYKFAPEASRRASHSFTTNSRECHGMLASPRVNSTPPAAY